MLLKELLKNTPEVKYGTNMHIQFLAKAKCIASYHCCIIITIHTIVMYTVIIYTQDHPDHANLQDAVILIQQVNYM